MVENRDPLENQWNDVNDYVVGVVVKLDWQGWTSGVREKWPKIKRTKKKDIGPNQEPGFEYYQSEKGGNTLRFVE